MGEREEEGVRLVRFFENDRGDKLRHSKAMQPDWLRRFDTRLIALRTSAVSSYWQKKTNNQNKKSYLLNFSIQGEMCSAGTRPRFQVLKRSLSLVIFM